MAESFAYVHSKIKNDDEVPAAIADAKIKAITKLGSSAIELYEWSWTPDWVCTTWRLKTPDVVEEH